MLLDINTRVCSRISWTTRRVPDPRLRYGPSTGRPAVMGISFVYFNKRNDDDTHILLP